MTTAIVESRLNSLAQFEPSPFPVISLYLNTHRLERGQDQFTAWLRKELSARARTFNPRSEQAKSFEIDRQRIYTWLGELDTAAKGVAIFACAGADEFFDAVQFDGVN
jgi:hypothetical protein